MYLIHNYQTQIQEFHQYCLNQLVPRMRSDVSQYAPGRYRLWLLNEPFLGNKVRIMPAYSDSYLQQILQYLYPGCNSALLSYHGRSQCFYSTGTIEHHRDAGFASPTARLLNLGNIAYFSYSQCRRNNDPNSSTSYLLNSGDLIEFNCKHLHACSYAGAGRMSLVMWQLKPQYVKALQSPCY